MSLEPGYGETPLDFEEIEALLPEIRAEIDASNKAEIYDLEQEVQSAVAEDFTNRVLGGELRLDDLLTDLFLRQLHARLYGQIWTWGGQYRSAELNIGVAPELVAVEIRSAMDNILFRYNETSDFDAKALGVVTHAEIVRVHPFADGNGRCSRLFADLVYLAAQDGTQIQVFDWNLDKNRYIELLREYDAHRDPHDLARFIRTVAL